MKGSGELSGVERRESADVRGFSGVTEWTRSWPDQRAGEGRRIGGRENGEATGALEGTFGGGRVG